MSGDSARKYGSLQKDNMSETHYFFAAGNYRLFGVIHEAKHEFKKEGFVFCAPFAEEKLWAHRVLLNFARDLADIGYPVLRFDYMGNGDSEGDFEESTLDTMLSDTEYAVRTLKEKVPEIESVNLLGLRFGATVAALVANDRSEINRLILWEPVVSGLAYTRELLRINLSTQSSVYKKILFNTDALIEMMKEGRTVNVDGYEMTWPLYEQVAGVDLLNGSNICGCNTLIVHISRKKETVNSPYVNLKRYYSKCELAVSTEEPFWKEIRHYYHRANNLYQVTMDWLK
jgi:exosortase A-associated hydrolase 2